MPKSQPEKVSTKDKIKAHQLWAMLTLETYQSFSTMNNAKNLSHEMFRQRTRLRSAFPFSRLSKYNETSLRNANIAPKRIEYNELRG
jgi:hypothetical protein